MNSVAVFTYSTSDSRTLHKKQRLLRRRQGKPPNHGLCDSNKLLYKRCAKSMRKPKIRPPLLPHFFNRSFWNWKPRKISGIRPSKQNLVDVKRRKKGLRKWRILAYFWFFLFCTLRVASRSHRSTDHDQWGFETCVSAQGSALWGSR